MNQMWTPWGEPDHVEDIAPGLQLITTPSHGGFKLSEALNAMVPLAWREASFNQQGMAGWYEEDCDVCLVILTFPQSFKPAEREQAKAGFKAFFQNLKQEP